MVAVAALAGLGVCVVGVSAQPMTEDFKFLSSDGWNNDHFGWSVAIEGGVVAVGVPNDGDNGARSGSAYLFDAATGAEFFKLLPTDGAGDDKFGFSISIDNGVVVVGAYLNDDNGEGSGSAYLFDAATGLQLFKLLPSDGAAGDQFGISVAIEGGLVVVGANWDGDNGHQAGSAYVFDALTGLQMHKLLASDGEASDRFGISVAIEGGVAAVGAWFDDDLGQNAGSAYTFDAVSGDQMQKLLAANGMAEDRFGFSIGIDDGLVAVGALGDDGFGLGSGAVYLFDASSGAQLDKLVANDAAGGDLFGVSVAFDHGLIAVGASQDDDNGNSSGSAYVFEASSGRQIEKLIASDGDELDALGYSVGVDFGVVVSGTIFHDAIGSNSGAVYVYDVNCYADFNGDWILDIGDIGVFVQLYLAGDPATDMNGDEILDIGDIIAFVDYFLAGC